MITNERLIQMIELLKANAGSKLPSDGLGIYLGDSLPRPSLGNLRSNELVQSLEELLVSRHFGVEVPGFNGPGT